MRPVHFQIFGESLPDWFGAKISDGKAIKAGICFRQAGAEMKKAPIFTPQGALFLPVGKHTGCIKNAASQRV